MKYVVFLIACCSPLLYETSAAFVGILSESDGVEEPPETVDVRAASELASQTIARVAVEAKLVDALIGADLFDVQVKVVEDFETGHAKAVIQGWRQLTTARALVEKYAKAGIPAGYDFPPTLVGLNSAKEIVQKLEAFLTAERAAFEAVPAAADVIDKVQTRLTSLQERIKEQERKDRVAKALEKARLEMNLNKLAECVVTLKDSDLAAETDSVLQAEVKLLRDRAEYRTAAEKLKTQTTTATAESLKALDDFLRSYPSHPSEAEAILQAGIKQSRDKTVLDLAVQDLAKQTDFGELLIKAGDLMAKVELEPAVKTRIRKIVIDWVGTRGLIKFESEQLNCLNGIQEGVTKSGVRKVGRIVLPRPDSETYKYWKDEASRMKSPTTAEQTIGRNDWEISPMDKVMYLQWADSYNEKVKNLLDDGGSLDNWKTFIIDCDKLQSEYKAYKNRHGSVYEIDDKCASWDFTRSTPFARTIVFNWEQYRIIVGK